MSNTTRLAMLCLLCVGCTPEPAPQPNPVGPDHYARGAWAWSIAVETGGALPKPAPVSGKCDNCNGTGRLGDGTVSVPCPVCGGDGKVDGDEQPEDTEPEPLQPPEPEPEPKPEPEPAVEPMPIAVVPAQPTTPPQPKAATKSHGTRETIWRRLRRGVTGR